MLRIAALILLAAGIMLGQTSHSITLTWPPGSGGGTVTSFGVLRATTSGGEPTVPTSNTAACTVCIGSVPFAALATSYTYTDSSGLVEGTTYYYEIVAIGPGGTSAPSAETSATVPFSPPATPGKPTAVAK